jgi:Flp pilus assembly protein TadG
MSTRRFTVRSEAGSETVELVILMPIVAALIGLVFLVGHVTEAHQIVSQAAEDAARAATEARSAGSAQGAADAAAAADLGGHLSCSPASVVLSGIFAPGATMTARVTCTTSLGFVPGRTTVTATAGSVVDLYRGVAS